MGRKQTLQSYPQRNDEHSETDHECCSSDAYQKQAASGGDLLSKPGHGQTVIAPPENEHENAPKNADTRKYRFACRTPPHEVNLASVR